MERNRSKVPAHLKHLTIGKMPSETCSWSLSGPQFPQPTAIQQRYCYPKGNPKYSGRKGGALWTMYGRDGKEDLEFRLLHVYFSPKRAANKGVALSEEDRLKYQQLTVATTPKKRQRVSRCIRSPWQKNNGMISPSGGLLQKSSSPIHAVGYSQMNDLRSGASSPDLPRVDRIAVLPPPSPFQEPNLENCRSANGSIFVSPNTAASEQASNGSIPEPAIFNHLPFHPVSSFEMDESTRMCATKKSWNKGTFRSQVGEFAVERRRSESSASRAHCFADRDNEFFHDDEVTVSGEASGTSEAAYWNDPLFSIGNKPSFEYNENETAVLGKSTDPISSAEALQARLESLHERIREGVLSHPASQQGHLLAIITSWARGLVMSPLESHKPFHIENGRSRRETGMRPDSPKSTVAV